MNIISSPFKFDEDDYIYLLETPFKYYIINYFKKIYKNDYDEDRSQFKYKNWRHKGVNYKALEEEEKCKLNEDIEKIKKYGRDSEQGKKEKIEKINEIIKNEFGIRTFHYENNDNIFEEDFKTKKIIHDNQELLKPTPSYRYFDFDMDNIINDEFLTFVLYIIQNKGYNDFMKHYISYTLPEYMVDQINKYLIISVNYDIIYYYDEQSRLYKKGNKKDIETIIYELSNKIITKEKKYFDDLARIYKYITLLEIPENKNLNIDYNWLRNHKNKEIIIKKYYDANFGLQKLENLNNVNVYELPMEDDKVLDLKTLKIKERSKESYFTDIINKTLKIQNIEDNIETPQFFKDITNNDIKKIELLQDILYYYLTGCKYNQCYVIFYGIGSNGKTTLLKALSSLYNSEDFIIKIKATEFNKLETEDLISKYLLNQKRIIFMDEFKKDCCLNETHLNTITDDSHSKLIISTNTIPQIKINCYGVERRIIYFPIDIEFTETPTKRTQKKKIIDYKIPINDLFNWILRSDIKDHKFNIFEKHKSLIEKLRENIINYNTEKNEEALFALNILKKLRKDVKSKDMYDLYVKEITRRNQEINDNKEILSYILFNKKLREGGVEMKYKNTGSFCIFKYYYQ